MSIKGDTWFKKIRETTGLTFATRRKSILRQNDKLRWSCFFLAVHGRHTPRMSASCVSEHRTGINEGSQGKFERVSSQPVSQWEEQSDRGQICHGLITPAAGTGACQSHDRTKMCQEKANRLPLPPNGTSTQSLHYRLPFGVVWLHGPQFLLLYQRLQPLHKWFTSEICRTCATEMME